MTSSRALFLFALLASTCVGTPEFVGALKTSAGTYVALHPAPNEKVVWVGIGETVKEYRVVSYDPKREVVRLERGGTSVEISLPGASVKPAPSLNLLESLIQKGDTELEKQLEDARTLDARGKKSAEELSRAELRAANNPKATGEVTQLRRKLKLQEENLEYYLAGLIDVIQREAKESSTGR